MRLPFAIDRSSRRKLTDQVVVSLRGAILNGFWKADATLPSRRDLSVSLCVSENVVRAALAQLAAERLIMPRPGTGCRVLRRMRRKMRGHVLQVLAEDPGYYQSLFYAVFVLIGARTHAECWTNRGCGGAAFDAEMRNLSDRAIEAADV